MFQAGQKIGNYRLIKKLDKGGFGEVWLAEKESQFVKKKVAIKLPHDEQVDFETIRKEASLWEQASGHPNVLPIIDADVYDGQVAIVSEYAEDGSLANRLRTEIKLPIREAVEMTIGILSGLEFLHSKKIIHRDIKPANILLQGRTPRLADFGISRAINTAQVSSAIVGTESFMSPESFEGVRNAQTDVWSVGVLLFQLLTGGLPFPMGQPMEMMYAVLTKAPHPLPNEIPAQLQAIIFKALEKDRELNGEPPRRYQTAAEMREDLQKFLYSYRETQAAKEAAENVVPPLAVGDEEIRTKVRIPVATVANHRASAPPTPISKRKFSVIGILAAILAVVAITWLAFSLINRKPVSTENQNTAVANTANSETTANTAPALESEKNLIEAIEYSKQGEIYYKKKQFDSAIAAFTKAIELNPNDFGTYNNRGIAHHVKREFDQAIADYTKAIELNPTHSSGYNNRGAAYEDLKDYEKAAADFQKAVELEPDNKTAQKNLERVSKRR